MNIYMSMIYTQLKKHHQVTYNHPRFLDNAPLQMPLLYSSGSLHPEYLYLTTALDLKHHKPDLQNTHIICIGTPDFRILNKPYEMICISESCDQTELFNEVMMIFQSYYHWGTELQTLSYTSQDLRKIFTASESILENPFVLIDKDFFYMAHSANFFQNEYNNDGEERSGTPLKYVHEFRLDEDFKTLTRKKSVFYYDNFFEQHRLLCHNLTYRGKYFARLIMREDHHAFTKADEHHLIILAKTIQQIFDHRSKSLDFSDRPDYVHGLLKTLTLKKQKVDALDIDRILDASEWHRLDEYRIIFLEYLIPAGIHMASSYLCKKIEELWKGSCAIQTENGILWLLNQRIYHQFHDYTFFENLAYFLRESLCKAGISNPFYDISHAASYYDQAKIALTIGTQRMPTHWYHYFSDYTLDYMLQQCTIQFRNEELLHPLIQHLQTYDQKHDTNLCFSLKIYLETQFSITDAAEKLYVHRTTLINRLKKIQQIYPTDFSDSKTLRHLILSFALLETTKNTVPG